MSTYAGVVVLYNPDNDVINNIEGYLSELDKLYVVDNSENVYVTVINRIKQLDQEKICYICLDGNKGIACALNFGIKCAIKDGYQWLLTMDQDSNFNNSIIKVYDNFIKTHSVNNIAILSPQYKFDRDKLDNSEKEIVRIRWTMQSANLLNLKSIQDVGMFKENFFIDCVDYEYCLRARKAGYQIIRCNKAVLNHAPATTKKFCIGSFNIKYGVASPVRYYYQVRNLYWTAREYKNIYMFGFMIIKFLKILLFFDNKKKYLQFCMQGVRDAKENRLGSYDELYGDS